MTSGPAIAKTVVIADDTGFVRDRFKSVLEQAGHRAIAVRSAVELLARVRADLDHIDLVVLDLRLPSTPGLELVRALRKIDEGRLTVLVFSGTIASADEVRELATLGCRRLRRTCSPTASIGAAALAWSSASRSRIGLVTPLRPR
jgi:CheY-like chemotaxis protein